MTYDQFLRYCLVSILITTFFVSGLKAQENTIDSLRRLSESQTGTAKVDALNALSVRLILLDFNLANEDIEKALRLSNEIAYSAGIAEATVNKAICENIKGNTEQSLQLLRTARRTAKKEMAHGIEGYAITQIANVYRGQGIYDSARYWYDRAEKILDGSAYKWQLSVLYKNIGLYYSLINNDELEREYLMRSLAIRQQLADKILLLDISLFLSQTYFRKYDLQQAQLYLANAQKYCEPYKEIEPQKEITYQQALISFRLAKYEEALAGFEEVIQFYLGHGNLRKYASLLIDMAEVLEEKGSYDLSLKNGFEALKISEDKKFIVEGTRARLIIARNYQRLSQSSLSHEYNEQAIALSQANKLVRLEGAAYNQRGLILQVEGKFKEALKDYEKGYALRESVDDKAGMVASLGNIGEMYEELGFLQKALEIQEQTEELAKSISSNLSLFWVYFNKSKIYLRLKNSGKASYYLSMADEMARQINYPLAPLFIYPIRRDLLIAQGNYKEALSQSTEYVKLKDSLNSSALTNRVLSLQSMYKLEKKDLEIALLNKSKEVQEERIKGQASQLRNREYILGLVVLALMLTGGMAYMSQRSSKRMGLLNREIQDRKEEIETQSEEISEANTALTQLNETLQQRQEEITAQSEELRESNDIITQLNNGLEQKVQLRTNELQQAYNELDTFFYRSSHDFRRPLTTFMGLAEVAKITVKDSNALDLFEKVKETAVNLDRMLIKLQSISDVGAQQFVYKETSMHQIFESTLDTYKEILSQRKIRTNIQVKSISSFSTYPAFLKIIMDNLVENSINFYSRSNPFIDLMAEEENNTVVIKVVDNGLGIEEEYRDRVFEMFFRGSEHSTGNGLGLYIVKRAVDKLNGSIKLETTFGKGTAITIILPKHQG